MSFPAWHTRAPWRAALALVLVHAVAARGSEQNNARSVTLIASIHQLDRSELVHSPAVHIVGVVTCTMPERHAVLLQDSTRGIYVDLTSCAITPRIGERLEVDGNAGAGEFSPFVHGTTARSVGSAPLPEPIRAEREQLIDGSLHCQYVEVEGYVASADTDVITLFMRSGRVRIRLEDTPTALRQSMLHTIVRIRGCMFATWDKQTRRITVGSVTFNNTTVTFERAAPADPFAAPRKRASELLQFDPQQSFFRRLCISGQVLYARQRTLFLADGDDGLRVDLESAGSFEPGDLVTASGFAEYGGPTPVIAEAVARRTGRAPLPAPLPLAGGSLLRESLDCRRVSVRATLIGTSTDGDLTVFDLESGRTRFRAELAAAAAAPPANGSIVEVEGVYAARGGNRVTGVPIDSFAMLLNSPADLRVIANPPWWTLRRVLVFVAILALSLGAALVWIRLLRRQVLQKTTELEREIEERQRLEHQRALEQERTRLANDLHDELGAGLTEVSMLGTLAATPTVRADDRAGYLRRVTDTSRALVGTLDEIVWAVNPTYDSVASLPAYFSSYAQRFLETAGIQCRLDIPEHLPGTSLTSKVRHQLFLSLKETLTNVVRHANATEVVFSIRVTATELVLRVADNGIGLDRTKLSPGMDGLASISARMTAIAGAAEVASHPGQGTTITLKVRLS